VHDSVYRQKTSVSSQKWKGYVTQKNEEYFTAIITDLSNKSQDEEVEIPLRAISKDDFHLVIEGAWFDWHIGYERVSGTTQKYSKILFKRMPRWTKNEFVHAKKLKQKFKDFLSCLFGVNGLFRSASKPGRNIKVLHPFCLLFF